MVKVNVRKLGAVLATAVFAQGIVNCSAARLDDVADREASETSIASSSEAYTVFDAGSGTLKLDYVFAGGGSGPNQRFVVTTSTTDEFVRMGQKLTLEIPGWLVTGLVQTDYGTITNENLPRVTGNVTVTFLRGGATVGTKVVKVASWKAPDELGWANAVTESFTVPTGATSMRFDLAFTSPDTLKTGTQSIGETMVFGGELPNKHAYFDLDGSSALRSRVLERGGPIGSSELVVAYSDQRADRVAVASGIDRKIGRVKTWNPRFGEQIQDLFADVVHVVSVGYSFDGAGFREEGLTQSALTYAKDGGSQEARLYVPGSAKKLSMYFRVKTYLVARYPTYGEILDRRYADGERVLVGDHYDNAAGIGTNYDFSAEAPEPPSTDVKRTVVFVKAETSPGQDMFLRGGIDHGIAKSRLGLECANPDGSPNFKCAIPITHRNMRNSTTKPWKLGDAFLDWYGREVTQSTASVGGQLAQGTAADWSTNAWPASFGAVKTVAADGFGVEPLNKYGMHYWMLDVDMDCSKAFKGPDGTRWFEVKTFVSNGPGWEPDVKQVGAPYTSINHFAKCGKVSVFERGSSTATFASLP